MQNYLASATAAMMAVQSGQAQAEEICASHIAHIAATEPDIQAWQYFAPDLALREARNLDPAGPLAGVTFAVKDVIDTATMPTEYGSLAYQNNQPVWDAPIIVQARQAGGIILGKSVATELAMSSPGKTRNPANPLFTPGGSSSGSAAAVAAGMAHIGFGTQTSGSIIRPAAFCGVVGYKPSFGTLNRTAIKMLSETLDTVGILARTTQDAALVTAILAEQPNLMPRRATRHLRIGVFKGSRPHQAFPETELAFDRACKAIAHNGWSTKLLSTPDFFEALYAHHDAVMGWETPRNLSYEMSALAADITLTTRAFLKQLSQTTRLQYEVALRALEDRAALLDIILADCDIAITQAAPGEAPRGLDYTGDPVFNKIWTLLHGPALTLPVLRGPNGLPVGIQLVARLGEDAELLAAAAIIEAALADMQEADHGSK